MFLINIELRPRFYFQIKIIFHLVSYDLHRNWPKNPTEWKTNSIKNHPTWKEVHTYYNGSVIRLILAPITLLFCPTHIFLWLHHVPNPAYEQLIDDIGGGGGFYGV